MALQVKDKIMLWQIDQLSRLRGISKTAVLRSALAREIEREAAERPMLDLLAPILDHVSVLGADQPMTLGEEKRLSDELWGEG